MSVLKDVDKDGYWQFREECETLDWDDLQSVISGLYDKLEIVEARILGNKEDNVGDLATVARIDACIKIAEREEDARLEDS